MYAITYQSKQWDGFDYVESYNFSIHESLECAKIEFNNRIQAELCLNFRQSFFDEYKNKENTERYFSNDTTFYFNIRNEDIVNIRLVEIKLNKIHYYEEIY